MGFVDVMVMMWHVRWDLMVGEGPEGAGTTDSQDQFHPGDQSLCLHHFPVRKKHRGAGLNTDRKATVDPLHKPRRNPATGKIEDETT